MILALVVAVIIGAVLSALTALDERIRIADEVPVAILVGVSGAVAGWALVDTLSGASGQAVDLWDLIGSTIGAIALIAAAWRGRRRTFKDLAPAPQPE